MTLKFFKGRKVIGSSIVGKEMKEIDVAMLVFVGPFHPVNKYRILALAALFVKLLEIFLFSNDVSNGKKSLDLFYVSFFRLRNLIYVLAGNCFGAVSFDN